MQIVVAKDTLSMVKLATEIEESTLDVADYGIVSYLTTLFRDVLS